MQTSGTIGSSGAESVTIQNDAWSLRVLPLCGGKIESLVTRTTGREWLWRNPHLPLREPVYGESYIENLDSGGWDEVFPSVDPCGSIPDHGDLVQLPWAVQEQGPDRLAMSVEGRCLPFTFERAITLDGTHLHFAYRLENRGDKPFPWLWCAHPLLALSPDLRIEADAEFEVLDGVGCAEGLVGQTIRWDGLPSFDTPWAIKLFSKRGSVDSVTARYGEEPGLRFAWDAGDIPYFGSWVNNGGWSGCDSEPYRNIGLEPTNLPVDDLSTAEDPPVLDAGQVKTWRLDVSLV